MKPFLCLLLLVFLASRLPAQEPPDDPQAGALVDCGGEKVAIFERTESKDGHCALGWTLRPGRRKEPFDWSAYNRSQPVETVLASTADNDPEKGDYVLVNGVLDLQGKVFTPLPSKDPYFPNYNHHGLSVAWSEERDGTRYALVSNDSRFSTNELFLVRYGSTPVGIVNLSPEADRTVAERMRKRDPKDYRNYGTTYEPGNGADPGGTPRTAFRRVISTPIRAGSPSRCRRATFCALILTANSGWESPRFKTVAADSPRGKGCPARCGR